MQGLVGLYRVSGGDSSMFNKLLASDTHRLYALQAARKIAEEGQRLQHFPPVASLRNDLAGIVRGFIRVSAVSSGI